MAKCQQWGHPCVSPLRRSHCSTNRCRPAASHLTKSMPVFGFRAWYEGDPEVSSGPPSLPAGEPFTGLLPM